MDVDPHVAKLTVPAPLLAARALWLRYALLVALRVVTGTEGALEIRTGAADGSRAVSRMGSGSAVSPGAPRRWEDSRSVVRGATRYFPTPLCLLAS